ncbi:Hypothetical predicted protein [Scomber scombrus]|uniref:Uncharacterized protein n=1 Tax=Scomber scombrus TaxID=13677 RepID=A0AAV1MZ26_SCOSC
MFNRFIVCKISTLHAFIAKVKNASFPLSHWLPLGVRRQLAEQQLAVLTLASPTNEIVSPAIRNGYRGYTETQLTVSTEVNSPYFSHGRHQTFSPPLQPRVYASHPLHSR